MVYIDIIFNIVTHFMCFTLALPTHLEHIYHQLYYGLLLHRFFSLNDKFNQLVSQSFCLLVTVFGLTGIDHKLFASFLLGYQQDFTDQLVVQFFDDV